MNSVTEYMPPVFMPCGRPTPYLMTVNDLVEFLRLEVRFPRDSIDRMREHGLRACQVGRRVLFRLTDVLEFLDREQSRNPR